MNCQKPLHPIGQWQSSFFWTPVPFGCPQKFTHLLSPQSVPETRRNPADRAQRGNSDEPHSEKSVRPPASAAPLYDPSGIARPLGGAARRCRCAQPPATRSDPLGIAGYSPVPQSLTLSSFRDGRPSLGLFARSGSQTLPGSSAHRAPEAGGRTCRWQSTGATRHRRRAACIDSA
jgi:hypothetical protein